MTQRRPFTFTAYDGIAFGAAALGLPPGLLAALKGPAYRAMFAEFGMELPLLTRLCLQPWFPLLMAALPLAAALSALLLQPPRAGRIAAMCAAIFLMFAAPAVWVTGMYLPISELSGKIQ